MDIDFEQRLREGLQARAEQVTPDPRTWDRVQEGIRRQRRFRLVLTGAAGPAVAALAAVALLVLPGALSRPSIELAPGVAGQPGGEGALEPPAADAGDADAAAVPLPVPEGVPDMVLAAPGGIVRLGPAGSSPVGGPDGARVDAVAVRPGSALDDLDLVYTAGCAIGRITADPTGTRTSEIASASPTACADGPRFAPEGDGLAWVEQEGGTFTLRTVGWSPDGDGEVRSRNAAFGIDLSALEEAGIPAPERLRVRDWVWTQQRGAEAEGFLSLAASGGAGGNRVLSLALIRQADGALALPGGERPTLLDDGDVRVHAYQHHAGVTWTLQDLPDADGVHLVRSDVGEALPALALPPSVLDRSSVDDGPVWLEVAGDTAVVGDGRGGAWAIGYDAGARAPWAAPAVVAPGAATGDVVDAGVLVAPERVADVDAPPADPAPAADDDRLDPPPTHVGLPAPVAEKRDAIRAAADAGDLAALAALTGPGFSFSFGGGYDPAAHWRAEMERGVDVPALILAVLDLPPTAVDGDLVVWPFAYDRSHASLSSAELAALEAALGDEALRAYAEADQYLGHRLGIAADGTWRFLIAGD